VKVFTPQPGTKLESYVLTGHRLLLTIMRDGQPEVLALNLKDGKSRKINFAPVAYSASTSVIGDNREVRVDLTGPLFPDATYRLDMTTLKPQLLRQDRVKGFQPSAYQTVRRLVPSRDGKTIPVLIVSRRNLSPTGRHPLLLEGYSSYGWTLPHNFSASLFSLLDRGFVYVIAHARGSDAKGDAWFNDGRMMNKKNTFNDMIDVAEFLIQKRFTSPDKLALRGSSAGGLLVGATINMRPDLFRAAIASVPFVDVLTTMLDPTIPLTTIEYQQWGNPNERPAYDYIKSYSPYDNVHATSYPSVLAITGLADQQVGYWEPTKWVQKLRDFSTSSNEILLKVNFNSGHSGDSGRVAEHQKAAETSVYLIKELGARRSIDAR